MKKLIRKEITSRTMAHYNNRKANTDGYNKSRSFVRTLNFQRTNDKKEHKDEHVGNTKEDDAPKAKQ